MMSVQENNDPVEINLWDFDGSMLFGDVDWREEFKTVGNIVGLMVSDMAASKLALSFGFRAVGGFYGGALFAALAYDLMSELFHDARETPE